MSDLSEKLSEKIPPKNENELEKPSEKRTLKSECDLNTNNKEETKQHVNESRVREIGTMKNFLENETDYLQKDLLIQ